MEAIQQKIFLLSRFTDQIPAEQAKLFWAEYQELITLTKIFTDDSNEILENNLDSDYQQAKYLISQSEEKVSKIFQSSPVAISISTLDEGRFVEVNNSFLEMTGYGQAELIGHTVSELGIWPSAIDRINLLKLIAQQSLIRSLEMQYVKKSGEVRSALVSLDRLEV